MSQIPNNFGALEPEFTDYQKSRIVILPVPYDGTRTWFVGKDWQKPDTSKGPKAIITASRNMELYDIETDSEAYKQGIHTLPELKIKPNPKETIDLIEKEAQKHTNKFMVMLGGEHSITTGLVRAYKEKYPDLSVLQFDAHTDLRDEWEEGGKYSHASVMARIKEICPVVQVGIRSAEQKPPSENIFYAKDMHNNDDWMDKAINLLSNNILITIDLDGFDPGIMPSVGTPVPGGLAYYQTLKFFKKLFKQKNIVAFDVVELAPNPNNVAPDFLAAKLVYKLLSYKFSRGE